MPLTLPLKPFDSESLQRTCRQCFHANPVSREHIYQTADSYGRLEGYSPYQQEMRQSRAGNFLGPVEQPYENDSDSRNGHQRKRIPVAVRYGLIYENSETVLSFINLVVMS